MVDLGFVDKSCELLESRFFPSKVGGKPAWLDLKCLPKPEQIICEKCNQTRHLLCQLYCPINEKDTAFHRTLFIFMCMSKGCFQPNNSSNFIVFRNQLSRKNPYYSYSPPIYQSSWRPDINCNKFDVNLCDVCGIKAEIEDEKNGKYYCSLSHKNVNEKSKNINLLPEFGLVIEPEDGGSDESCSEDESSDGENENTELMKFTDISKIASAQNDPTVEHFFNECQESAHDKYFFNFKTRIMEYPEQVIRYGKNTKPLWISSKCIPEEGDIPACELCGSEREFEFQILPQLLNHLNLDKDKEVKAGILDWGVLAIYTCKNSCNIDPAYKTEFLWKQDLVE